MKTASFWLQRRTVLSLLMSLSYTQFMTFISSLFRWPQLTINKAQALCWLDLQQDKWVSLTSETRTSSKESILELDRAMFLRSKSTLKIHSSFSALIIKEKYVYLISEATSLCSKSMAQKMGRFTQQFGPMKKRS